MSIDGCRLDGHDGQWLSHPPSVQWDEKKSEQHGTVTVRQTHPDRDVWARCAPLPLNILS